MNAKIRIPNRMDFYSDSLAFFLKLLFFSNAACLLHASAVAVDMNAKYMNPGLVGVRVP
jgi:hypothetical protein